MLVSLAISSVNRRLKYEVTLPKNRDGALGKKKIYFLGLRLNGA